MVYFDKNVQTEPYGPLTFDFQKRILAVKERLNLTFGEIARQAGFSGSYLGNMTRYRNRVGPGHASQLAKVIETLEATPPGTDRTALPPPAATPPKAEPPKLTVDEAILRLARTYGTRPEWVTINIRGSVSDAG